MRHFKFFNTLLLWEINATQQTNLGTDTHVQYNLVARWMNKGVSAVCKRLGSPAVMLDTVFTLTTTGWFLCIQFVGEEAIAEVKLSLPASIFHLVTAV